METVCDSKEDVDTLVKDLVDIWSRCSYLPKYYSEVYSASIAKYPKLSENAIFCRWWMTYARIYLKLQTQQFQAMKLAGTE